MLSDGVMNGFGSEQSLNERTSLAAACVAAVFLWATVFLAFVVTFDLAAGFFVVGIEFLKLIQ